MTEPTDIMTMDEVAQRLHCTLLRVDRLRARTGTRPSWYGGNNGAATVSH